MPRIAAARFVRYARTRDLSALVCPPYDSIDEQTRAALEARHPNNFVRLVLPREQPGDAPGDRYRRAGALLDGWLQEGVLVRDGRPALLRIEQEFTDPLTGERRVRRGIEALLQLGGVRENGVLPHEETHAQRKADRLELLRATRAHLSPVFALFPDEKNEVMGMLAGLPAHAPDAEAVIDGTVRRTWIVRDERVIADVARLLAPRRAYLADGHNRFATALRYREQALAEGRRVEGTALDYIPAFLCSMSDPGLLLLPVHRVMHSFEMDFMRFGQALEEDFDVGGVVRVVDEAQLARFKEELAARRKQGRTAFGLLAPDGTGRIVSVKPDAPARRAGLLPGSEALRRLDVTLLNALLLERLLGLPREPRGPRQNVRYELDAANVATAVRQQGATLGVLLNPPDVSSVQEVAEAGEVMPSRTTHFHPKPVDGLFVQLLDGEPV